MQQSYVEVNLCFGKSMKSRKLVYWCVYFQCVYQTCVLNVRQLLLCTCCCVEFECIEIVVYVLIQKVSFFVGLDKIYMHQHSKHSILIYMCMGGRRCWHCTSDQKNRRVGCAPSNDQNYQNVCKIRKECIIYHYSSTHQQQKCHPKQKHLLGKRARPRGCSIKTSLKVE
jgi:hypothetical protein